MNWNDVAVLLPEIIITIGASLLLLGPFFAGRTQPRRSMSLALGGGGNVDVDIDENGGSFAKWWMLALLAITAASVIGVSWAAPGLQLSAGFSQMFALDAFSIFFKLLFIVVVALVALLSEDFLRESNYSPWEYYSLLGFALCGTLFMASGVHLIAIWVGLELLSLSSYILAGYYKNEEKSTEAAMKYFILGSVSSAIMLYGMSLIYGVCGSLNLLDISKAMSTLLSNDALMFGIMLLGVGLCFKVGAAPFHVWTPDVYVGAPTPITAFLSTASKAAAFAIFARIFYVALHAFHLDWSNVIATVAALSMIVGNVGAVTQTNIKRLMAYSSIGHAGYILLGIVSLSPIGIRGVLVYTLVYVFATLGIWTTILMMRRHEYAGEQIDDFEGLSKRAPFWAFAMVIFLLSLGGIPPTAGFIGKYYLFAAAIQAGYGWLAIIAVLMSAVSIYYYFKIVVAMYLREGREAEVAMSGSLKFVGAVALAVTLIFGMVPAPLIQQVEQSSQWVATRAAVLHGGR